ncbi:G-type lectin S-receptor-like serine/threonine-protein kinase At1g34300 [Selaginella moellendorffii]|uniref:G-type lectin S-receptor-like serine/threonine-protein kinase At1g34300 n=1 Tax=Selaginella moellendorffii TaxID=88036 RepID=UPI000D1C82AE|nr:G-type lectin S-receptor-like serine/threonine-protein kinase At1g34300 [Selaginella moellendorffii]|eukprot:XP_024522232.1 G-type lectin S-receptor-like serine/threonine-protein kinase At1g34300 [Selaginella moellendorffii]
MIVWLVRCDNCSITAASLQETGNLVLLDRSSDRIWQSFNFPTDTLLPGQELRENTSLVAGKYRLSMNRQGIELYFQDYLNQSYWGIINKQLNTSDLTMTSTPKFTFGIDGHLAFFYANGSSWYRYKFDNAQNRGSAVRVHRDFMLWIPVNRPDASATFPLSCSSGNATSSASKMVEVPRAMYVGNLLQQLSKDPISLEQCKDSCLKDCRCLGATYMLAGTKRCSLLGGEDGKLFNGVQGMERTSIALLKVSALDPSTTSFSEDVFVTVLDTDSLRNWSYFSDAGIAIGELALFLCIAAAAWFCWRRSLRGMWKKASKNHRGPTWFSYEQPEVATNHFSCKLGAGGFGSVYKGVLPDMTVPRRETRPLEGFSIALGVAKGITYLHECYDCILRDIKPQNILLDENFCPKVLDFGLAKLIDKERALDVTTIRGTRGYMAPVWVGDRPITSKVDVYSYGMVLLELLSGNDKSRIGQNRYFPVWAFQKYVAGERLQAGGENAGAARLGGGCAAVSNASVGESAERE